jgi:hypothetical protein
MKLRYSEAFYSVQGEGKFVGVPSVFLRTFGCNFRCMNFGLKNEPMRDVKQKQGIIHNAEVQGLIDAGIHETTNIQAVILMQVSIQNLKSLINKQKLKKL